MIYVSLSFVFGSERVFKFFGVSLASVAFLCAFVLGSLLLPAALELVGRRAWQPPRWLSRRPPKLERYSPSEAAPALETSS
jgi:RND superfamily putative drug exporter